MILLELNKVTLAIKVYRMPCVWTFLLSPTDLLFKLCAKVDPTPIAPIINDVLYVAGSSSMPQNKLFVCVCLYASDGHFLSIFHSVVVVVG